MYYDPMCHLIALCSALQKLSSAFNNGKRRMPDHKVWGISLLC